MNIETVGIVMGLVIILISVISIWFIVDANIEFMKCAIDMKCDAEVSAAIFRFSVIIILIFVVVDAFAVYLIKRGFR